MKKIFTLCLLIIIFIPISAQKTKSSQKPYVILVSFDGFRWDYSQKANLSVLDSIAKFGTHAESLQPAFPTKTFPNHYTIATGMYPDHTGIVNNTFYSPDHNEIYKIGKAKAVGNGTYYKGTPIWNLAEQQGVKSASFYWVGSEAAIQNQRPSRWKKYEHDFPFEQRVDSVISWLQLPEKERPHLVLLYFHEPDSKGHKFGPDSKEVKETIVKMNGIMERLFAGINSLPIKDEVNVIITSDHGMSNISNDRVVNFTKYINPKYVDRVVGGNPLYNIWAKKQYVDSVSKALKNIEHLTCWENGKLPKRLHYGTNKRTGTHTVVADLGWTIQYGKKRKITDGGTHGYDNKHKEMHAIFYAIGPNFKQGYKYKTILNIDIYPLIANVLGLKTGKIDGKFGRVKKLLRKR